MEHLTKLKETLSGIPDLILNGIKDIFVPDTEAIQAEFDSLLSGLKSKLGIDVFDLDSLFSGSAAPTDIKADYSAGGLWSYSGTFVDMSWVVSGVEHFRPYIRGFIVLLLVFYNIRQALSMFGLSSGEISSASESKGGKES